MARLKELFLFLGVKYRTLVDELCVESVAGVVGHDENAVWSWVHQILKLFASTQQGIQEPSLFGWFGIEFGHCVQPVVDCWALVGYKDFLLVRLVLGLPILGCEGVSLWFRILRKYDPRFFCCQS